MPKKIKVVFVQTEGWFFLSHFQPLAKAILTDDNYEGAVITTVGDAGPPLEALGLKVLPLNFERASFNLLLAFNILLNLIKILREQRPDIVHFISLRPILLGSIASLFLPGTSKVVHITGLGYLADGKSWLAKLRQEALFRLAAFFTRRKNTWLITENPDDLTFLQSYGATKTNTSLFGGAGVDPEHYAPAPTIQSDPVRIAYVGRMIWSKGVDVLVESATILHKQDVKFQLDLFGAPDLANPNSVTAQTLESWNQLPNVTWHGVTSDARQVWAECEIAILPTRTREGMPRAMLEAASCARALIVTDVPGCRHFVNSVDLGILVPPDDADALASAIKTLILNPKMRLELGQNARRKILKSYTEAHIQAPIIEVYKQIRLNPSTHELK